MNEATARIKINTLLEAAGWRFFADGDRPANIQLEPSVTLKASDLDALGDNFDNAAKGFIDFLLLDPKGFPLIVLEAKSEDKNPLVGKEQARKYARSLNCRFVMLSNGNLHYFWDLERGNPYLITAFPTPDSVDGYQKVTPNPQTLVDEQLADDYIYVNREVFDKPEEYYTLAKLRKAAAVDRRLTLREILERVFGIIPRFKSKDELLEEEFAKFVADHTPTQADSVAAIKTYFKAYAADGPTRDIIDKRQFSMLATSAVFSTSDYRAVPKKYRVLIPEYVKDYVSLNQF